MFINKAILYGNLTRDPELRALPSGMNVASFSIATNRTFKDKNGAKQEEVTFHNVVVFGKQADNVAQYLKKGSGVFIEGRMQTKSWEDSKTGEKKYRTEVVAESVQFGPRSQAGVGGKQAADAGYSYEDDSQDSPKPGAHRGRGGVDYPDTDINPDDIPF